jgi:hypothetical protein
MYVYLPVPPIRDSPQVFGWSIYAEISKVDIMTPETFALAFLSNSFVSSPLSAYHQPHKEGTVVICILQMTTTKTQDTRMLGQGCMTN